MEVTPKTFREVEFREKMRGYHPEDVDQFLEQMATAVEAINDRLTQADERVQRADERAKRAEAAAAEAGNNDESLRRTLVLAQRTADLAIQEAREQASRLVSSAEQQAKDIVSEAEDRARRLHGEALADVHAELAKLEATRTQAQQEVDALSRWAAENRTHLSASLAEAQARLDQVGLLAPPPSSTPIEVPAAPPVERPAGEGRSRDRGPVEAGPAGEGRSRDRAPVSAGPATETRVRDRAPVDGGPATETRVRERAPVDAAPATQAIPPLPKGPESELVPAEAQREDGQLPAPDEEGFDDGEFDNGARFGGRLRRRH